VLTAVEALPGLMLEFGGKVFSFFWNGLLAMWADVRDWFTRLPDKILDAVGDIASSMLELGKKIVKAIIDGIKASPGALIDAIKDLLPGAGIIGGVAGKIGGLLGFASGGVVPGSTGAPRLAVVHGGEAVFNPDQLTVLRGALRGAGGTGAAAVHVDAGAVVVHIGQITNRGTADYLLEHLAAGTVARELAVTLRGAVA
jgi:hypothetical protein